MYTIVEALTFNYENYRGTITADQVGKKTFGLWNNTVSEIFAKVKIIKNDRRSKRICDFQTEIEEIYSLVSELMGIIGMVNGFPLKKERHLPELFVAFATIGCRGNEGEVCVNTKVKTLFNLRLERYFARLIIEQSLKSSRMLEDEMEDVRAVRKITARRRKRIKENKKKLEQNSRTLDNIAKLEFTSVLVRCSTYKSHLNHCIQKIPACLDIVMSSGAIIQEEVSIGYCAECNVYFILEYDYNNLRTLGVLLCQVVADDNNFSTADICNLKPESLLHQSGYNVSASGNLSTIQRQEILRRVIANKLYTPVDVINFLDWLIKRNSNVTTKNMDTALSKWKADREYIIQQYIQRQ